MAASEQTDRLVILNCPHPKGIQRELADNPRQQKNSEYARVFQQDGAAARLTPELLAAWVKEPEDRKKYVEALKRSSAEGMLNYYKANYPRPPYKDDRTYPPIRCRVLLLHGLDDKYLLPGRLNDTWKWVEKDLTLVTIPGAGHFVHRDAKELVTRRMVDSADARITRCSAIRRPASSVVASAVFLPDRGRLSRPARANDGARPSPSPPRAVTVGQRLMGRPTTGIDLQDRQQPAFAFPVFAKA